MEYKRLFESDISGESVKAWRVQGKKAIGVVCCHVPEEILMPQMSCRCACGQPDALTAAMLSHG